MPGTGFSGLFGSFWGDTLVALVENATVSEDILRDKVVRTLTPYFYLGQDVNPLPAFIYVSIFLCSSVAIFDITTERSGISLLE